MHRFSVTARGLASVEVDARNWLVALGHGLAELGREELSRLACEVLPNGTVIARDIVTGTGFIVQQMDAAPVDATLDAAEEPGVFALDGEEDNDDGVEADEAEDTAAIGEQRLQSEEFSELPLEALAPLDPMEQANVDIGNAETVASACVICLQAAMGLIPCEAGAVLLEERGHMRFMAVDGPASRKLAGVRIPLGTGVAGFALEHARTVVLANAADDPRHCGDVDALTGYTTQSIVVVPIAEGPHVRGVLELLNAPERFTEEQVEELQQLARYLAERLGEDTLQTP